MHVVQGGYKSLGTDIYLHNNDLNFGGGDIRTDTSMDIDRHHDSKSAGYQSVSLAILELVLSNNKNVPIFPRNF